MSKPVKTSKALQETASQLQAALIGLLFWTEALTTYGGNVPVGAWRELARRQEQARDALSKSMRKDP